ncbi:lipocalin family protein [Hymenobacter jejuensis]|uniref:Lipocalin family protein n=1 Tax=Hymenobacter jejuensis TaxID=2502781 RepID=A0A5B8A295_9BACT|nr:lipocalin family protein [Hymenobacter jejuensis]QDA61514.1 lipocalin family protein [Hymenobacter jejuensis]
MKTRRPILLAAAATAAVATTTWLYNRARQRTSLPVARYVDLKRYSGLWYEIARLPTRFEKGCQHVTAHYHLRSDGKVDVVNTCHQDGVNGPVESVKGVARVVDPETNAKLKVSFFWPFEGDYWILDLDPLDYRYALVGEPGRKNLWLLSRTPQLPRPTRDHLVGIARSLGFPVENLIFTAQPLITNP